MTTGEADTSFPPFRCTHRGRALSDEMIWYCQDVMRSAFADFEAELREFNQEHHHVHLLVFYPPKIAVSALVNRASLRGHFWSPSYFAASCGGAPLSIINQYIEQQRRPG